MNSPHNQILNLLRFPLAVVVISIHVFGTAITVSGQTVSMSNFPLTDDFLTFMYAFLKSQSVPIYFFISGYVFFLKGSFSRQIYLNKLKNRVHTLLIPYLLWNIAFFLFLLFKYTPFMHSIYPNLDSGQLNLSVTSILSIFGNYTGGIENNVIVEKDGYYPLNFPLWFLRELMIVVIFTPVIYQSIKRWKGKVLCLLGLVWLITSTWGMMGTQTASAFFFFSWGAYISIQKTDMMRYFNKRFKSSVILYFGLGILYIVTMNHSQTLAQLVKSINIMVGLYFAYNMAGWFAGRRQSAARPLLPAASFFLYIAHAVIYKEVIKLSVILIHPHDAFSTFAVYALSTLAVVFILLGAYCLLKRFTPSLLTFVTGRK